jgi:hypothetical protein
MHVEDKIVSKEYVSVGSKPVTDTQVAVTV